jgi:signal transduction histidine kinase
MNFLIKNKLKFVISLGILHLISSFVFQGNFLIITEVAFSLLIAFLFYNTIKLFETRIKLDNEKEKQILDEKEKVLKGYNSYINQLSNIIAGLNHEVSPWLGGIQNKINRVRDKLNNPSTTRKYKSGEHYSVNQLLKKLDEIEYASNTAINILRNRSKDIKKLQNYSNAKSNLFDTLETWVSIAMVDRSVKCDISLENINLNFNSLNFKENHSPLLLSQVILNLVKNSVEHNENMLENLMISISGDAKRKCLIYEDNGKGIPDDKIDDIFTPGITSKKFEKEIHGLGLSLCVDYCECMGAAITAEKSKTGAKFVIYFDYDFEKNPAKIKNIQKRTLEGI